MPISSKDTPPPNENIASKQTYPEDQIHSSLTANHYLSADIYQKELARIWRRHWIYVGRADELKSPGDFKVLRIAEREILLVLDRSHKIGAFYNACSHRGSVLCEAESGQLKSGRIICPYHQWSYGLTGELLSTPRIELGSQATSLGLDRVLLTEWAGNLYLNLDQTSDLTISDAMIPGPTKLNNWPLSTLKVRHRMQFDIRCNWKIFWENYLECYHCPGIHPELCRIVPLYQAGLATDHLKSGFKGEDRVASGVESWTETGRAIAPTLEGLSKAEVKAGHTFLEIYPNQYIVAHPDYVRQVSILPSAPGVTRVTAEWLFAPDVSKNPSFDPAPAIEFCERLLHQDARVSELNQRGLAAKPHHQGVLIDLESDVWDFHEYYRTWMKDTDAD